jgi:hypothetical protein
MARHFKIDPTETVAFCLGIYPLHLYGVHLANDTLSIAFESTVFSLIPKENTTVSIGSVLKCRARSL